MKVASIFGKKNERKTAESFIKQAKDFEASKINQNNTQPQTKSLIPNFEQNSSSLLDQQEIDENLQNQKAKYIFAAINKAEERKYIQEEVKQKRFEREIEKWEKEHGKILKFSTFGDESDIINSENVNSTEIKSEINIDNDKSNDLNDQPKVKSLIPSEEDFEAMRERYMERLKTTGILQFPSGKKAQVELLYYPEICGVPVITE